MSTPDIDPTIVSSPIIAAPELVAPPAPSESDPATVAGALAYLDAAAETIQTAQPVDVGQATPEAEALAFKVAAEHGFQATLAAFKDSIEHDVAQLTASVSNETKTLLAKGISALKALIGT